MLRWSPEQIAMRMRLVFLGEVDMRISGAKSIHERPEIVKENIEAGHLPPTEDLALQN